MSDVELTPAEVVALCGEKNRQAASSSTVAQGRLQIFPGSTTANCCSTRPLTPAEQSLRQKLRTLHAEMARNLGAALSGMVRSSVEVKLRDIEIATYADFIRGQETAAYLHVITAEPLPGKALLQFSPAMIHPLIDRLLGGESDRGSIARNVLTEIEQRLARRVVELFIREMTEVWSSAARLNLSLDHLETNSRTVQEMPAAESVAVSRFEVTLGQQRGEALLCVSTKFIMPIFTTVVGNRYPAMSPKSTRLNNTSADLERGAVVELTVRLGESTILPEELGDLAVGDIITTQQLMSQPVLVSVEGVPKFHAHVGQHQGHKAIRIERRISQKGELAEAESSKE